MHKINVGQIGYGYWGPNLLRNFLSNNNSDVIKVAEKSKERREVIKDLYKDIEILQDPSEIFQDEKIDTVVISTPASTHFELSIQALNHNKHIFVEKPLAMKVEEIDEIERIANNKKLIVMVGHTFIFNNAVKYIKKLIDQNSIGDLRYIYSQRVNLGRIRSDVNAMWNLAPHDISIIQYWLDNIECESVQYFGMDYMQNGIDDVSFINLNYPNKVIANIHVSWLDPRKIRRITLVGSKKMVVYDDISENKVTIYDKGIDIDKDIAKATSKYMADYDLYKTANYNHRFGEIIIPEIKWVEPLKNEVEHFVDCVLNNKNPITDIKHAREVVRILQNAKK